MKLQRTPLSIAMLAAVVAPLSSNVSAQTAEDDVTLKPVKVQEKLINNDYSPVISNVGAKTPTPIRDVPQTVNVINRAVLDSQNATSLKDALRNVPGITLSAGEGGQIGDNINLRGFNARTDIYIDGFRDRGQYTRDTFYLDSIEVLKGPSSMLFGRGSTGGVINQSSKKPDLKARGEISASIGTDDYYRTTLDINQPIADDAAFRLAAFGQNTQSTRDVIHNKDFGVAPSLRFGIGTPTEITLSALVQRNNDIPDYGFPLIRSDRTANSVAKPLDAPKHNFYGYLDDHFDQDVDVFNIGFRHAINDALTLNSRVQYSQYRIGASPTPLGTTSVIGASGAAAIPTQNTPIDLITGQRQDRDRIVNDSSLFNQTDLVAKFVTGSIKHTLTSGMEIGLDRYRNTRWSYNPTNVPINLGEPVNGYRGGVRFKQSVTETNADTFAMYVNDQLDLNEQWKLIGGLRWDRFRADADAITYLQSGAISTVTPPSDLTRTDKMTSVRAGVIYQPDEMQSYYVSYGASFNPSAEAVTLTNTQADVSPEKNRSYEIGAKYDLFDAALQLNAAVFQIEKTNARTTDLTGIVNLDGDTRVRGFELSAVGYLLPAWQILAGYTHLDGEVVDGKDSNTLVIDNGAGGTTNLTLFSKGKTLQNTPRDTATVWTTYTLFDAWEIGGGAVYASRRYVNNFETAEIDGYTRWDATIAFKQPKYDVRLNLQNLTDKKYFEAASGGRATPANGRAAILTTTYRF